MVHPSGLRQQPKFRDYSASHHLAPIFFWCRDDRNSISGSEGYVNFIPTTFGFQVEFFQTYYLILSWFWSDLLVVSIFNKHLGGWSMSGLANGASVPRLKLKWVGWRILWCFMSSPIMDSEKSPATDSFEQVDWVLMWLWCWGQLRCRRWEIMWQQRMATDMPTKFLGLKSWRVEG